MEEDPASSGAPAEPEALSDAVLAKLDSFFDSNGLSGFGKAMAKQWIVTALSGGFPAGSCDRVVKWLLQQLSGKRTCANTWQRGCPELLPGLSTRGLWVNPSRAESFSDARLIPWVTALEANFEAIQAEVLALRDCKLSSGALDGFQQYRTPVWATPPAPSSSPVEAAAAASEAPATLLGTDAGDWNVYYLHLHNADYSLNRSRCPITCAALDAIPRGYEHSFLSAVAPHTHITKHNGPTNKKLRCHLPLVVPQAGASRIRVGDETIPFQEGKCFVFDDSFEHEVWNDADASRIVLIVDVWHPDLSNQEIKFLKFLNSGQLRLAKMIGLDALGDRAEDFYAVLERARKEGASESAVFSGAG